MDSYLRNDPHSGGKELKIVDQGHASPTYMSIEVTQGSNYTLVPGSAIKSHGF